MLIECHDNAGFEDLLTSGRCYPVIAIGRQSVQLHDDYGQLRWFGRLKFAEPRPQQTAEPQAA